MGDPATASADSVVFHEYPKLIYAWPLIVMGFAFWFLAQPRYVPDPDAPLKVQKSDVEAAVAEPAGEAGAEVTTVDAVQPKVPVGGENEVLGWVYLVTLFLVVLTLSVDVERNYAAFWGVAVLALWLATWLLHEKGIPVFTHVYRFFADMNVSYDRGYGLALSIFLLFPFVGMLIWARLNDRWRITHNEFEHYSWGRADDSLARGAKRVRTTYPDLLEFLLGLGAGTLIVYSTTGRSELKRIHNVPMLFMLRQKINRILESTQVTPAEEARQETLADEAAGEEGEGGGEMGNEKL